MEGLGRSDRCDIFRIGPMRLCDRVAGCGRTSGLSGKPALGSRNHSSQRGHGLRRRYELGLIFSLITLLVQLIAPVSATYAMANAGPLDAMPTCAHHTDLGNQPSPIDHQKSCPCCALMCSVSHAAFPAPSDIPSTIAASQRQPQKLVFKVAHIVPAPHRIVPLAQPRAPPASI